MKAKSVSALCIVVLTFTVSTAYGQPAEQCGPATPHFESSLGMEIAYGCYVNAVLPGSLAEQQGLSPGDIVTSLNEKKFRDFQNALDFVLNIKAEAADTMARLTVLKYLRSTNTYEPKASMASFRISTSELKETRPIGFRCIPMGMILGVGDRTPASVGGVRQGYFIHAINGERISDMDNAIKIDQAMREAVRSCKVVLDLGRWGRETSDPNGNKGRELELHQVTISLGATVGEK